MKNLRRVNVPDVKGGRKGFVKESYLLLSACLHPQLVAFPWGGSSFSKVKRDGSLLAPCISFFFSFSIALGYLPTVGPPLQVRTHADTLIDSQLGLPYLPNPPC